MIAPKNKIMIKNTTVTQKYGDYFLHLIRISREGISATLHVLKFLWYWKKFNFKLKSSKISIFLHQFSNLEYFYLNYWIYLTLLSIQDEIIWIIIEITRCILILSFVESLINLRNTQTMQIIHNCKLKEAKFSLSK